MHIEDHASSDLSRILSFEMEVAPRLRTTFAFLSQLTQSTGLPQGVSNPGVLSGDSQRETMSAVEPISQYCPENPESSKEPGIPKRNPE